MSDPRKALFAACRQLGLDEDARRDLLQSVVGVRSTKDLSPAQWAKMLDHLNRLTGFSKRVTRALCDEPQAKKLRALWLELHAAGKVREPSEHALAAFCKRHTGVEALQWLTAAQAQRLIEHLKKWMAR